MRKSIFLSLLIALTTICSSCSDDDESGFRVPSLHFSVGDLSYTTNTNGTSAQLSGCADKLVSQIDIPSNVIYSGKSYAITSIGSGAFNNNNAYWIIIPESITSIGDSAFRICSNLAWMSIPDKVTSIGDCAFAYSGIGWITMPSGITSFGDSVFAGCTNLQNIYIRDSIPPAVGSGSFYQIDKSTCKLYVPIGSKDAYAVAEGWKEFQHIEESSKEPILKFSYGDLKYTTNDDGTTAYVSGTNVKTVSQINILSSVTYTGKSYTVTSIGNRAFRETGLSSITIPESITSIGDSAFYNCSSLALITLPSGVTSIGNCAFAHTGLTSITLPDGVTSVEDSVFYGCTKLQEIYIRNSIPPSVGIDGLSGVDKSSCFLYVPVGSREAFVAAAGWKEFLHIEESDMLPIVEFTVDNLKYISNTSGTSVYVTGVATNPIGQLTFPSNITYNGKSYKVTEIAYFAFGDCTDLTSITIPSSVTSIANSTFYDCNALTSITIPSSVTSIGEKAFSGCEALTSITIPSSVTSIANSTFYDCNALTSITIPFSVTSIGEKAFSDCRALTSITIPSSVTSIGKNAFSYCSALTSITLPENVISIEMGTFSYCSALTSITLPSSVTHIGTMAFWHCDALTQFVVENGNTTFVADDGVLFTKDKKRIVAYPSAKGKYYTILSNVTSIGDYAFLDCTELTSITIPSSVTTIGSYAFAGCSGLKEFYVNNSTPPSVGTYGLNDVYYTKTYKLYVPVGSKEAYAAADQWKNFMSIEEMNMTEE